jgi:hypothetical protein
MNDFSMLLTGISLPIIILLVHSLFSPRPEFGSVPKIPRLICWLYTSHRPVLRWRDFNSDIPGRRCLCGKIEVSGDLF